MANARKDLMKKVHDVLAATSSVTDMLFEGADGILYTFSSQTQQPITKPKPFIVIVTNGETITDPDIEENASRIPFLQPVTVLLIEDDVPEVDQLDLYDNGELVAAVLYGASLKNPAISGHKTYQYAYGAQPIWENGVLTTVFTLDYRYYQNK